MNASPNSPGAPDGLEMLSEPAVHIYGKRCAEPPPVNDDAVQTVAEPLCSFHVHLEAGTASENETQ